jgi:uncharacterized protein YggU (UPF0235/DUF167 family)
VATPAWSVADGGLTLHVRLTPRADRDRIDGIVELADGRRVIAARVRAVPENGAANRALSVLLAKKLGVAKSSVRLTSGATTRVKTLAVDGPPGDLLDRIKALVG